MNDSSTRSAPEVLLVEDETGHARLVQLAFKEVDARVRIHWVRTGDEALEALQGPGAAAYDLVLLDLNLPRTTGHDVLAALSAEDAGPTMPVIVLSSSADPGDILTALERGANGFIKKPDDYDDLVEQLRALRESWLTPSEGTSEPSP